MKAVITLFLLLLGAVVALPGCIIVPRGEHHYYYYTAPPPPDNLYYYNPKDGRYYPYHPYQYEERHEEK